MSMTAIETWKLLIVGQGLLVKRIDRVMRDAGVVGLDVYDVLLTLELNSHHKMKMCELAERVLLSRSGLTRLADRLVSCGYIERQRCSKDGRSTFIHLTSLGLKEREKAWPILRDQIGQQFEQNLTNDELQSLGLALHSLVKNLEPQFCEDPCSNHASS